MTMTMMMMMMNYFQIDSKKRDVKLLNKFTVVEEHHRGKNTPNKNKDGLRTAPSVMLYFKFSFIYYEREKQYIG